VCLTLVSMEGDVYADFEEGGIVVFEKDMKRIAIFLLTISSCMTFYTKWFVVNVIYTVYCSTTLLLIRTKGAHGGITSNTQSLPNHHNAFISLFHRRPAGRTHTHVSILP
jgi:hypothetical protein